ncbi:MAG: WYL domain-containing protein [Bacteroidales bacterium]|nr:WYL domain-containing protein [Bacteroidales bacterium]
MTKELSIETTVSKRQIYADLKEMELSPSMQAPIVAYQDGQRKYYRYAQEGFSIVDLTNDELLGLETTVNMLASFRGMPQFDWMTGIIRKLKKKYKVYETPRNILSFDSNVDLRGIDRFKELFNFIINEQPIKITYEPFCKSAFDAEIHPYYLKQYNNRWFILGYNPEYKDISVFALDRIKKVESLNVDFIQDTLIEDPFDYFFDVIGTTIPNSGAVEKVVLKFSPKRYQYVSAKPIHHTQKTDDNTLTATIEVNPNKELEAIILGFGKDVEVLAPEHLRNEIIEILTESCEKYGLLKNDCKSPQ